MKKATKTVQKSKKTTVHKKHSQQFLKVYWPYIPVVALVFMGLIFGYNWPTTSKHNSNNATGVLAYATEMSSGGLLSATNTQRSQNGAAVLTSNSKLASAAQAKANDMVARNYWSHTTPDGKEPWVFIDEAGYSYKKAGENLAYGFDTSNDTIIGWMNSPSHRSNMLDASFKEVGFGFANAPSYVGTGEETVVVAMYAIPSGAVATAAPATTTQPTVKKSTTTQPTAPVPAAQPTNQDTAVAIQPTPVAKKVTNDQYNQPVTSDNPIPASQPTTRITKLQSITSGHAPWSATLLSIVLVAIVGAWIAKHAYAVKKVLVDGEKFLLHHPIVDVAVLFIVGIAILLSQSSGVVK